MRGRGGRFRFLLALGVTGSAAIVIAACLGDDPEKPNVTSGEGGTNPPPITGDGESPTNGDDGGAGADAACVGQDLTTSTQHCGACFRDCLGGTCDGGVCSVWTVTTLGLGGQKDSIHGLAINPEDNKLYAAMGPSIYRVKIDGSEKETLTTIDAGLEFTGLAKGQSGVLACTTNPDFGSGGILLLPIATNGVSTVEYRVGECNGLVTRGQNVFSYHDPYVYQHSMPNGAPVSYTAPADAGRPTADIDFDGTYFYWVNENQGLVRAKLSGPDLFPERVDKLGDGGNPEALSQAHGLAVIGAYAYVTERDVLSRIALDGGARTLLWNGERGRVRANQHMAYDPRTGALYFGSAATIHGFVPPPPPTP